MVYPQDERNVLILGGRGNDYLLDGSAQMLLGIVRVREAPSRLDHHLGTDGLPRQLRRILFGKDLNCLAVDRNAVAASRDLMGQISENRIVLQEMSQGLGIGQVVDGYELQVGVVERGTQNIASDAPEPVNPYFDCHVASVQ